MAIVLMSLPAGAAYVGESDSSGAATSPLAAPHTLRDRALNEYLKAETNAPDHIVRAPDYSDNYADDAGDGMFFLPGVWVNYLDAHEPQISARGYGLANRHQRTGLRILRDGAPVTDVHGDTYIREVDSLAVDRIDFWRGSGSDLRLSGDTLGGALNFISPTGRDRESGLAVRVEGGSSIEASPGGRAHAETSGRLGRGWDFFASATGGYETGFRDNNERNEGVINFNLGYTGAKSFASRFFVEALRSDTEYAGGLTLAELRDDPSDAAGPITLGPLFPGGPIINLADGAVDGEWGRELTTGRVSNETRFRFFGADFTANAHYTRRENDRKDIEFIGVSEESSSEWGASLAARHVFRILGFDTQTRFGGGYATGDKDSVRFENLSGERGDPTLGATQDSTSIFAFAEAAIKPFQRLVLDLGVKFTRTDRDLTIGDDVDTARFTGIAARGGLTYALRDDVQVFAVVARSYEPPTFSELLANNPADISSLDEQDTFGWEIGLRGKLRDRAGWDITYFNTDIEGDIINVEEPETNGFGGTLVNVDKTRRKGVEAGLDILVLKDFAGGDISWRSVYQYNNYRFIDGDPLPVDGNRIAGTPEHVYRGEIRYNVDDVWFFAVNAQVAAGDFYADHMNTVKAPTYTAVGFSAGYRLNERTEIFASGENLTDVDYAIGVTPVLLHDIQTDRIYVPAHRASVYGGLRYKF